METVNIAFNNYQKSVNVKMTQLQNEFNRLTMEFKDSRKRLLSHGILYTIMCFCT
jgi:hypothetical protein